MRDARVKSSDVDLQFFSHLSSGTNLNWMTVENDLLEQPWKRTFREAFCARFNCAPERYEAALFWRCFHRHALAPAIFIYRSRPEFFREDFALVGEVANAKDNRRFVNELNYFYGRNVRDKNWVRKTFAIRISAKRLLRLKKLFVREGLL